MTEHEGTVTGLERDAVPRPEPGDGPVGDAAAIETIAALRRERAQLEDRWRRAVADVDNLRMRVARDAKAYRVEETARVAALWLPVLDNLDLALDHAEADPKSIVEGLVAVRDQALAVLTRLGFPRRCEVGGVFDPALHEAVAVVSSSDTAPGTILRVVRPGYGDDRHPLRPAAVVVTKDA